MKFLITGANGFIGKALCAALIQRGQSVRAAVRGATSLVEGAELVIVGKIDGETDWTNALRGVGAVIHLAARVHVMKESAADPLAEYLKVNLDGTKNLAVQAACAGVKRFVYVSSVKVNGEQTHGQQSYTEQDTPTPQDSYGITKYQAENALHHVAQETGLEMVIVRPPLVYGPGVKGNFISLLSAINRGIPLPLAGANNARSLIYVGNLVDALIVCATHPNATGQTYLVSDGEPISTALLVKEIADALGRKNHMFYFPPGLLRLIAAMLGRADKIDRLFGSLHVNDNKIRQELSWSPPYTLTQGLRETVNWYCKSITGR
ncbi:MAG: SDR family oxidoreductase [Nitrosomonas sp.]|nr:SDR family oxidoreductase [Nitrosomonas sp.]